MWEYPLQNGLLIIRRTLAVRDRPMNRVFSQPDSPCFVVVCIRRVIRLRRCRSKEPLRRGDGGLSCWNLYLLATR